MDTANVENVVPPYQNWFSQLCFGNSDVDYAPRSMQSVEADK